MIELTKEQKKIIIDLLLQISVKVAEAPIVIEIINILKEQIEKPDKK